MRTKPYISAEPAHTITPLGDQGGFVIVACDGVWDEMSTEAAVETVGKLLAEHPEPGADIAGMLIEETLTRCASAVGRAGRSCWCWLPARRTAPVGALTMVACRVVVRLRTTVDEERDITLEEMKRRPCGKDDWSWRSCLHDDITCIVLQFKPAAAAAPAAPKMKKAAKMKKSTKVAHQPAPLAGTRATHTCTRVLQETHLHELQRAHPPTARQLRVAG
jgi:hypothetical protein